jgi:peptidoglycan/LPS O-acetylase OafA/YrhL
MTGRYRRVFDNPGLPHYPQRTLSGIPPADRRTMDNENLRNPNLDFVRGAAALAVVMNHLSNLLFARLPAPDLSRPASVLLFLAQNVGNDAVMVFFVLSGYFVGGSVVSGVAKDRWSWADYAVKRLARLWIVLIPALLLTFFWDSLAIHLNGHEAFVQRYNEYVTRPPGSTAYSLGLPAFLGNAAFLHEILFDSYGSDRPLWSLSYEFWYYVLFPCLYLAAAGRSSVPVRALHLLAAVLLMAFLPRRMADLGLVWLMGVGVHFCGLSPRLSRFLGKFPVFALCLLSLTGVFLAGHLGLARGFLARMIEPRFIVQCGLLGAFFAGMIPFLRSHVPDHPWYARAAHWLSDISYTLYLVHLPFLVFWAFTFRWPPRPWGWTAPAVFLAGLGACVLYARGIWWLFERRTHEARHLLRRLLGVKKTLPQGGAAP